MHWIIQPNCCELEQRGTQGQELGMYAMWRPPNCPGVEYDQVHCPYANHFLAVVRCTRRSDGSDAESRDKNTLNDLGNTLVSEKKTQPRGLGLSSQFISSVRRYSAREDGKTPALVDDTPVRFFNDGRSTTKSRPDIRVMTVSRTVINLSLARSSQSYMVQPDVKRAVQKYLD